MSTISSSRFRLWRGSQPIIGLAFDLEVLPGDAARQRVLAEWTPGARLYRTDGWLVLVLPHAGRRDCASLSGYPLVEVGGDLTALDLRPEVLRSALNASVGLTGTRVLLARGGHIVSSTLSSASAEDPALWLDLPARSLTEAEPLGAPPPPPVPRPEPAPRETHDLLGEPELKPSTSRSEFLNSLTAGANTAPRSGDRSASAGRAGADWTGMATAPFMIVAHVLSRLGLRPSWGAGTSRRGAGPPPLPASGGRPETPRPPGPLRRAWGRVLWFAFENLTGDLVARRQARYLRETMEMFEQGDLAKALRHAVPLGTGAEALQQLRLPSFLLPRSRFDLGISTQLSAGGTQMLSSRDPFEQMDIYNRLKQIYQHAFEELDRQGKTAETAFVLAELLQDTPAAVSYLERKGQFRLAAELAEGRQASPALVVRQWLLAGETERAVLIARRHAIFAEAVRMLEATHPREADKLRLLWAEILADGGNFAAAVDAIWDVDLAGTRLKNHWLDLAIAQGGATGARMLVRKLANQPDIWDECLEIARPLLAGRAPDEIIVKQALADALCHEQNSPSLRRLAALTSRALLRDLGRGSLTPSNTNIRQVSRLLESGADRALSADLPRLSQLTTARPDESDLRRRTEPLVLEFGEPGSTPVFDEVLLPKGRILAALGEAGVALLSRDGRVIFRFAVPAHSLVPSAAGNRALAVARRGDHVRLARLDLDRRTVHEMGDARLARWAPEYDGTVWMAEQGGRLFAFDLRTDDLSVMAQTPASAGPLIIGWGKDHVATLECQPDGRARFQRFSVPALEQKFELLLREEVRFPTEAWASAALHVDGYLAHLTDVEVQPAGESSPPVTRVGLAQSDLYAIPFSQCLEAPVSALRHPVPTIADHWITVSVVGEEQTCVLLLDRDARFQNRVRAHLMFPGTVDVSVRFQADFLMLADTAGRIVCLNLTDGNLTEMARIRM